MIYIRFITIALRKYAAEPGNRRAAVKMLLRYAVCLAVLHLGEQETAGVVRETLTARMDDAA